MKEAKRINWPLLTAKDIEVRIATCKDGKTTLLLYQNSRTAMNAFDKMFGEFGWQCEYYNGGGQIYCKIGVYDDNTNQWVWKSDTGAESNIEAEKGFSSDAFKRVAVRWGYARELYTTPKIVINNDNKFMKYNVTEIGYNDNREINHLVIADNYGNVVYTLGQQQQKLTTPKQQKLTSSSNLCDERIPTGLYGKTVNAQSMAALKSIWDSNSNYHNNKIFINLVNKQKAALSAA